MYNTLLYEKKDTIGILTINRPEKMNALSTELTNELQQVLAEIEEDKDLRVLVITGAGEKAFVAGADINELVDRDALIGRKVSRFRQELFSRVENLPIPVIGAVNGFALGGGTEIAIACDFIYASENAKFGQPEINLGVIPGFGGTQRLPRLIGTNMAKELIFTGKMISAFSLPNPRLSVNINGLSFARK